MLHPDCLYFKSIAATFLWGYTLQPIKQSVLARLLSGSGLLSNVKYNLGKALLTDFQIPYLIGLKRLCIAVGNQG